MRSIIISLATAAAIVLAEFTVLPFLMAWLPANTTFAASTITNSVVLGFCAGVAFFVAISHLGYPSTNPRFPTVHKKFALIIAHVTFSFEAVLYPLTVAVEASVGTFAAIGLNASVMAVTIGAVSYWLTALDSRTMNFGTSLKKRVRRYDYKMLIGVIFASCCITVVPVLTSINQQLILGKTENANQILILSGNQRSYSQTISRLALSDLPADRAVLVETLATVRTEATELVQMVASYAQRHNLSDESRMALPGNPPLQVQHDRYLALGEQFLRASDPEQQQALRTELQLALNGLLPAMDSALGAFQDQEENFRDVRETGQWLRTLLGPFVFLGLSFGLFWPLLRLVNAQRYGLDMRRRDAEAAMVAKGQFLATMSHELRTPMNGVLGMLRLMIDSGLTQSQQQQAKTALNSGNDLLTILNDILDFSKLERGQMKLEKVPLSPAQIAREVMALLQNQAEVKNLELRCSIQSRVPDWLGGDPTRIRQILINLVGNAIKFTDNGSVEVRIKYKGSDSRGVLRIEVKDTGVGIPDHAQMRIFERFSQADETITRKFGGTGLGLSISRQLVELMGGEIGLKSTEGFGSTFWFVIPVRPVEAPAMPVKSQKEIKPLEARKGLKILAAEDNPVNQQVVTAFVTAAGHDITVVDNGEEAVAALYNKDFDVILMDIQMPVMDGITATRQIRKISGSRGQIPIIALTANAMDGDREKYLEAGMTDYISKPINPDKLKEVLSRVFAASTEVPPKVTKKAG